MISGHAIPHYPYAGDSQLYVSFASQDSAAALNGLQSCLASVQSWTATNKLKLNWTQIQLNSSLSGTTDSGANTSLYFLLNFFASKLTLLNLLGILGYFSTNISSPAQTYQQSFAHAFTICGICGVFAVTLIWIVQYYLQLLLCPVISTIAIHPCMVLPTLTSQASVCSKSTGAAWWQSLPFTRSLPLLRSLHWLLVRFRILFKKNLSTYKTLREKQPVYLHSKLAASLPSRSLRSNNDNCLSVPRVKTNTGARACRFCAPSLWNSLPLSVRSAISVATFKKTSEDTSLWLGLSL